MNQYLSKFGFQAPTVIEKTSPNLGLIVVIPCFNEPDIIKSIESLAACKKPLKDVEIIVVINHGEHHDTEIIDQNKNALNSLKKWSTQNNPFFKLHVITSFNLPKKHAGVGLARKIGMDEAVARFDSAKYDGLIICFDADSTCDKNYFTAIENHFEKHLKAPGAAIRYEHPIEGTDFDGSIYEGIINYELFLRYYNQGLIWANLPFAFHTVGSSMAVRCSAYQKQGGMNKRKAGEDFYFLHKIIALGNFTEINNTKVIPSPRTSDRVPFGTGKAISDWINNESKDYLTYDVRIWDILKDFNATIPLLQLNGLRDTEFNKKIDNQTLIEYLDLNNFNEDLKGIRLNSTSPESFLKRFFVWFNAFRVLKLVHYLRDKQFPNQPIFDQAKLMSKKRSFAKNETTSKSLLLAYRKFEAN
ncbi:MAG: glycosyltransferase family 2 protein [Crocinitomicaceae bacterium]